MILTEVKQDEGLNFIVDVKEVPPYEHRNGVRIELISERLLNQSPEFKLILTALGYELVGLDECTPCYIYAKLPFRFIQYKIARLGIRIYWWTVRWLYLNARIFQQIEPGYYFSWSYFTPYVWARKLKAKLKL